ncbi:MAG: T9SS type A sorting domain-containing protein [Saprospiraceae bacterium]|nr:T9SS type A sorting domain-containing protein [Saprospiraceae bacterium]
MSPIRLVLLLAVSLLWHVSYSQQLRAYKSLKVLAGQSIDVPAESRSYPDFIVTPQHGTVSKFKYGYEDVYRVRYSAPASFVGVDTVVYKTQRVVGGVIKPFFEGFVVAVSRVIAVPDYYAVNTNESNLSLDVLANDEFGAGDLHISKLSYISNGSASISADGKRIVFTALEKGYAKIGYTACAGGDCSAALVILRVDDSHDLPAADTSRYEIMRDEKTTLLVAPGFNAPSNAYFTGDLIRISDQIYEYVPQLGYSGTEILKFSQIADGSQIFHVISIVVKDPFLDNGWNVDDRFYTEVGNELIIDLSANDLGGSIQDVSKEGLIGNLYPITDHTYRYIPAENFAGQTTFTYRACAENRCDEASVHLTVHNYEPLYDFQHLYTTRNSPLELKYAVPIDDFQFSLVQPPAYGTVEIAGQGHSFNYSPDPQFEGTDGFVVRYCAGQPEKCKNISLAVSVQPLESAGCQDCVWPGDHNNDGQVDIQDAVVLATNIGYSGPVRTGTSSDYWYGQEMEDWPATLSYGTRNLKYVDGNGDGILSTTDLQILSHHYMKAHNLVPKPPPGLHAIPLNLEILTPEVESGDWAVIEVSLGSASLPASDMLGVNFSLEVGGRFVDSSSVQFILSDQGIFNPVNSVIAFAQSPKDGTIDVGIGKIDKNPIQGHGVLGQIRFIVEEDLNGFRSLEDLVKVRILAKRIALLSTEGQISLEDREEILFIGKASERNVMIYPNPAESWFAVSGKIQSMRLLNLQGQLIKIWMPDSDDRQSYDLNQLPAGSYFVEIVDEGGKTTIHRLEVAR